MFHSKMGMEEFGWIALPVALNAIDAILTIKLHSMGCREINPLMSWLLEEGTWAFVAVKLFVAQAIGEMSIEYPKFKYANLAFAGVCAWNGWILYKLLSF